MSLKQWIFGPRTVNALGVLLMFGLLLLLVGWGIESAEVSTIGWWLTMPFVAMLLLLVFVAVPHTWLTRNRR